MSIGSISQVTILNKWFYYEGKAALFPVLLLLSVDDLTTPSFYPGLATSLWAAVKALGTL